MLTKIQSNKNKYLMVAGAIIYIFLFLLICNLLLPITSDDIDGYLFWGDGIKSFIDPYLHFNSRLGEMIDKGFLAKYTNTVEIDYFISILGILFFLNFFVLVFGRLPKSNKDAVILLLSLFLILRFGAFGSDFVWVTGAMNYLWGMFWISLVLIPYRLFWGDYFAKRDLSKYFCNTHNIYIYILKSFIFFIISLIAGWSFELGIMIPLVHIAFFMFAFIKKIKLPIWYYSGFLGFSIGYCILYFAPGPKNRAMTYFHDNGEYIGIREFLGFSLIDKLKRLGKVIEITFSRRGTNNLFPISIIACTIYMFCNFFKNKTWDLLFLKIISCLYAIWFFQIILRIQTYYIPGRAFLFMDLLLCAIILIAFFKIYSLSTLKTRFILSFSIVTLCLSYSVFVGSEYLRYAISWNNLLFSINDKKSACKSAKECKIDIVVREDFFKSRYKKFGEWGNPGEDPNVWPNNNYAKYLGVNSFRVE